MEWVSTHAQAISAADAAVEAGIAVLTPFLFHRRVGYVHPIVWVLTVYFAIEALVSLNRAIGPVARSDVMLRTMLLEVAGTVALVAILLGSMRIVRTLVAFAERARARAEEYERARHDYAQVVRHRINNPLTIIKGAAQTLEADVVDDAMRHQLRLAIIEAATVLEDISLEPERRGGEERELDAIAHVPATDEHRP